MTGKRIFVALSPCLLSLASVATLAGQTIQPGFYSHEPSNVAIRISGVRSGELCTDATGTDSVCSTVTQLTVQGNDTCVGTDGKSYPCTRYGYRYDYDGATPGTEIHCQATRNDGFNKRQKEYSIALESDAGSVFQPEWISYGPVDRRTMLTEVHECSYLGAPLATIEYIINYEPSWNPVATARGGPDPDIDEPFMEAVPRACNYLTAHRAAWWVRDDIQATGGAIEHMPNLRSHCAYTGIHAPSRDTRLEFKFHLFELFDTKKLSPMQVKFHATFAAGGNEPVETLDDPGKIAFVYRIDPHITVLSVVTGMQGPPDGAGRPMEFLAHYYLQDAGRSHAERLECLMEFAEQNVAFWHAAAKETGTFVAPPALPEWPIERCDKPGG